MNLSFSPAEQQFRTEVREFLSTHLPVDLSEKVRKHIRLSKEEFLRWHRILHKQGWVGASWPTEYGGTGWNAVQQHLFSEECAAAHAPLIQPFGVSMVGPVIMAFGSDEQKNYYLPRILSGEDWWCQGYSEPGAGSDLGALKTSALRQGDHYIVNGQKTWTTLGQYANLMFCLVRTDTTVAKQKGISFLLIDMNTPGITVRPIIMLNDEHEVNEVFLEDVKVPVENLVGNENEGWTYAKYLLGHERTTIAAVGRSKSELIFLKELASKRTKHGRPLLHDPVFAARIAEIEIDLLALELMVLEVLSTEGTDKNTGPDASILKIKGTDIQTGLTELMMDAVGPYAAPLDLAYLEGERDHSLFNDDEAAPLTGLYLNYRKTAIYGGSTEIQKNILSRAVLGL